MKKRFLKLLAAGSLATVLGYGTYAYGCADGWWGAGYSSIFSPEITVSNKNYEPFFYDDYTIFYNGYSIESTTNLFKQETITDWTLYLKKYTPETIEYFLYNDEVTPLLSNVTKAKSIEAELKKQNFKFALDWKDGNTQKFVIFLMASRGIEHFSNQTYNYWDYDNRTQIPATQDYVSTIEALYNTDDVKDDVFLKNRMWFQVLRTKFYSDDKTSAITFFNETSNEQPKNSLYYRGLSYVAGAYKSLKNYEKSNVLFAQVFNQSKPMMPSALFDYKPLGTKEFEATVQSVSDPSTKEALYALQGYYTNGFDAMKKLYEINPSSEHLNFLLSRWVNINEQSLNVYTEYETLDVDPKKIKKEFKSKVDASQLKWINSIADGKKTSNPYIWKATAAYFNSFVGNYKKSNQQLQEAFQLAKNQEQKGQVRSLRLLNNLLSIDDLSIASEGKLIEDVNWLFYDQSNTDSNYYTSTSRIDYLQSFKKKYVSALYQDSGNKLMSELTYPIKGFYKDQKQSAAMEQLLLSNSRTAWQDLFVGVYPYKLADIYESRGIYLFYEDKIDEAIAEFEKIIPFESRTYNWETEKYETQMMDYKTVQLPGNPFNGKIKDCNDCDHVAKQTVKYSQLDFLKKVKEMKANVAQGNDVYHNALLVGNAFYNASYFGNARAFYYNSIVNEYSLSISNAHANMLYGMSNVKKYYHIAQQAATTNEEKAKMAYMLAKIERNDFYANTYFMSADGYWGYKNGADFNAWQGFQDLKNNYADTKYYQDVIAECGYFRKYLGM